MKAVALFLLVACGASFELTTKDVADFLDGVHYHHSTLRSFVKEYIPLPLDVIIPPQHEKAPPNETCCECREHGAKRVMEHAVHRIIEMCKRAEDHHCGKAARVCMMMRLHKEVTLGMVIEHVRPFAISAAYCTGKGVCHHNSTLSEIASGHEAHDLVLKHFDEIDWDEVLEKAKEPEDEEDEEAEKDEDEQEEIAEREMKICEARQEENAIEAKQQHFCPRCFKKVMKHVMWKATTGVKMMCSKTHDRHTMRMCEFAYEHREVAFGMLLAKVEPWKFAMGACSHHRGRHHGGEYHHKRWQKAKKFVTDVAHKFSEMITI